jgi:hypothetical protein
MSQKFDMQAARSELGDLHDENFCQCDIRTLLAGALDHIAELEKAISEPVEAFGTPELIAWSQELARLLDVPEEERGEITFVISVGCHLEKFVNSWRSPPVWQITEERKVAIDLLLDMIDEDPSDWNEGSNGPLCMDILRAMLAEAEAQP